MFKWHIKKLHTTQDLIDSIKLMRSHKAEVVAIDTETTGLHILLDRAFLFQYGYYVMDKGEGYVYTVHKEREPFLDAMRVLPIVVKHLNALLIGHNLSFDLHMLANDGAYYNSNNAFDTTVCIRLAHDAIATKDGGVPLELKLYAAQYIDRRARDHERLLDQEKTSLVKTWNSRLKDKLRTVDKSWTLKKIDEVLDHFLADEDTFTPAELKAYHSWLDELPPRIRETKTGILVDSKEIPYDILDKDNIELYGAYDIIYTLETYLKTMPAIKARGQQTAFEIERNVLMPFFRMERVGFYIDTSYVKDTQTRLKTYIKFKLMRLNELAGFELSPNQNAVIKQTLKEKYNVDLPGTNKDILEKFVEDNPSSEASELIEIVMELRSLIKWYQTYLMRMVKHTKDCDRVYTQIKSAGTVSGRVTSDFQQFPKYGITTSNGESLFNPRQMVQKSPDSEMLVYIDYSQIELRLQAMYTILVGHPDENLCRAYMPYNCHNEFYGNFDYNNKGHLAMAYSTAWFRNEDNSVWKPIDVHTVTTMVAFPDVPVGSEEFDKLRGTGKRVNFAKNYGAQYGRIKQMFPELTDEMINTINDSYYNAFPGVKMYHQYCNNIIRHKGYGSNLFGGRYYGITGHKLKNMAIQGSGAYLLKIKIAELDNYIMKNNLKTRMQMNIHDEISFELAPGEFEHVKEFKRIMEQYDDTLVPIIADIELSTTTWAAKKGFKYE